MSIARVAACAALVCTFSLGWFVAADKAAPTNRTGTNRTGTKQQAPSGPAVKSSKAQVRIPAPAAAASAAAQPAVVAGRRIPASPATTRTVNGRPNRTAGAAMGSKASAGTREGVQPNPVERQNVPARTRPATVRRGPQPVH